MNPAADAGLDVEWYAEQNRDAWKAGRQSVFADLQAAYDRGYDVGLGADQEHRAEVHAIMNDCGGGIGHRARAHATLDGFNDGTLIRKQFTADLRERELAATRAERQAQLEPEAEPG